MNILIPIMSLLFLQNCSYSNKTLNNEKNLNLKSNLISVDTSNFKKDSLEKKEVNNQFETFNNLKVTYEENLKIPKELIERLPAEMKKEAISMIDKPIIYKLLHNGNSTSYKIDENFLIEKKIEQGNKNSKSFALAQFSTYKNYLENILIIKSGTSSAVYLINGKLKQLDWKIMNESKLIGKYLCKKAITTTKDGKVTAYFTDEIPVSEGPSIYGNLPGLILYLEAPDRNYKAIKIEFAENVKVERFKDGKNVTEEEYNKIVEKQKNQPTIKQTVEEYHEN